MGPLKKVFLGAAALLSVAATGARADVLVLGAGWDTFYFGAANVYDVNPYMSPLYDNTNNPAGEWDFTLASAAFLNITDAYFTGDWFELTINGIDAGPTSGFTFDPVFQPDFDQAFRNPSFSSASYYLPAGSYQVTGVALLDLYGAGVGGIELSNSIPEPGAWTMMLTGLAGLGALIRRRRTVAAAAAA